MELSFDELILQIRKGNEEALELLFLRLENNIKMFEKKAIYNYHLTVFSRQDIKNIILSETMDIINNYEFDRAAFYAFWKLVITRKIGTLYDENIVESNYGNFQVSIDTENADYLEDASNDFQKINKNPINQYISHDEFERIIKFIDKEFGEEYLKVILLWADGYKYNEITEITGKNISQVNYIILKTIQSLKAYFK